jgi:hypothetical protein
LLEADEVEITDESLLDRFDFDEGAEEADFM